MHRRTVVRIAASLLVVGCASERVPSADARVVDGLLAAYAPGVSLGLPTRAVRRARPTLSVYRGSDVYLVDSLRPGLDGFRRLRLRYPRDEERQEPKAGDPVFGAELTARGDWSARRAYERVRDAFGRPPDGRRCVVEHGIAQIELTYWAGRDRLVTLSWWLPSHVVPSSRGFVELGVYVGGIRTLDAGETELWRDPPECPPGTPSSAGV